MPPKRKLSIWAAANEVPAPAPRRSSRNNPILATSSEADLAELSVPACKKRTKDDRLICVPDADNVLHNGTAPSRDQEEALVNNKVVKKDKGKKKEAKAGAAKVPSSSPSSSSEARFSSKKQYWLLKAEPESRLEKGVDVKFSIDDLASRTEPEPWEGIRNYVARNNLRAMRRGDLAFFYHSNCKDPGIVGIMEVVKEHSPDLTAHDSSSPYYDATSKASDPKWSLVHVTFKSKFAKPISLRELKTASYPELADLQLLKQPRLSVNRVTSVEWEFLTRLAERKAEG